VTGSSAAAGVAGLPHRAPVAPAPSGTGERLAGPPPARPAPAVSGPVATPAPPTPPASSGQPPARPGAGGPITVPPLPPISTPVAGSRRPLSSEDFEEELDIPEFLRSQ
jgi:cell division protein FtsZ